MTPLNLNYQQKQAALKTLAALSDIDDERSPHETAFLEVVAEFVGATAPLPEPCGGAQPPDDLASIIAEPEHRTLLVQGLIVLAMMDAEVTADEVAYIRAVAGALGVVEPRLRFIELYSKGHRVWLQGEVPMRSEMIQNKFKEAWDSKGLLGVLELATLPMGLIECKDLQEKYDELGSYPLGTLGRAYFDHMQSKGYNFPGHKKAFPEVLVVHDLTHILAGFDTDPTGECEVISFIAGYIKADPFWYIFMILLHMHLDLEVFYGDATARLAGDPRRMADAFARGLKVNTDLYDRWDFWVDFPLPLDDVREKYNIVPA